MQRRSTERHGFRFVRDDKLRGALGETNFKTKTVRVNVRAHTRILRAKPGTYGVAKKNATVLKTLAHEQMHIDHPKMSERMVEKRALAKVSRMGKPAKRRLYNKLKRG